jgi:hypothetical protein
MMSYFHALDLDDFYPCWNLSLDGRIWSPNYLAKIDPGVGGVHRPIEGLSIEELRQNGYQGGAITPRSTTLLIKAAILRQGQRMVDGYGNEILISEEERERILNLFDAELRIEEVRRSDYADRVSRLSCIWLADATQMGRQHLTNMLGPYVYITEVSISNCLSLSKVDTYWYDKFLESGDDDDIHRYWSGVAASNDATWEYLLDGEITVNDPQQIEYIRQHGTRRP